MSLLVLDRVSQRYGGQRFSHAPVLRAVSLTIDAGEVVGVWGRRRSGRTTLLSVAAGVEPPTEGAVRFDGVDLRRRPMLGVRHGVGFCAATFPPAAGGSIAEQVATPLLGAGADVGAAADAADAALRRLGAGHVAERDPGELSHSEATRVMLARALVMAPRLIVIDQPVAGVPPARERDAVLEILRSLADREGIAILMAVDEAAELAGVDRALTIDTGELRGEGAGRGRADVIPLRRSAMS